MSLPEEEVVIRTAELEDRPRTDSIRWAAGWIAPPARHRHWPEAEEEWQARHYYRELVAEADGMIVGRIGLEAYYPPFAQMLDLAVRPEYRRRGIGTALMRACRSRVARRGFCALYLQTEIDNTAAHRLYTSLGFLPLAHGVMLRMVHLLDYPLAAEYLQRHPLASYRHLPAEGRDGVWNMEWSGPITGDLLTLSVATGSTHAESRGLGPALQGFAWKNGGGKRFLSAELVCEPLRDIEPGRFAEMQLRIVNQGGQTEEGVAQVILPPGIEISPLSEQQTYAWHAEPGQSISIPFVVQVAQFFDNSALWRFTCPSVPVCAEVYWQGHRALLSASLHMAAPPGR